jgi:hypothetical protein
MLKKEIYDLANGNKPKSEFFAASRKKCARIFSKSAQCQTVGRAAFP